MGKHKTGIDLYKAAAAAEKSGNKPSGSRLVSQKSAPRVSPGVPPRKTAEEQKRVRAPAIARPDDPSDGLRETPGFIKIAQDEISGGGSRAARLLLLLGKDEAAKIMARLSSDEAERIARQIASIRRIDAVEARKILEEFGYDVQKEPVHRVRGGVDTAREMLTRAFGEEKANQIIVSAVPESVPKPFAFLADLSFTQVMSLIRKEPPHSLALIMSYIDPALSSRILESLPDSERSAVVLRMARTQKVSRDVLAAVESTLQEKRRRLGKDESEELDGRSALADILRYMDISDERRLLYELGETDESLAEAVKEKLFTMDTVLHLRNRDLQRELAETSEKDIALVLKGQPVEIQERINSALSSRRRLLVADEADIMGRVKRTEADAAVRAFLERLREKEENGTYIIIREEEDLI